jgi:hypothetical protein
MQKKKRPAVAGLPDSSAAAPASAAGRRLRDEPDLAHPSALQDREGVGDIFIAGALVGADVNLRLRILDRPCNT